MNITRRRFVAVSGVLSLFPASARPVGAESTERMYGLIGRIDAVSGQRDALAEILLEGMADLPGCLSYVVALDPERPDSLWVTEVWDSKASHAASLELPGVQAAIARGRPLIAGFADRTETMPLGGHGLAHGPTA